MENDILKYIFELRKQGIKVKFSCGYFDDFMIVTVERDGYRIKQAISEQQALFLDKDLRETHLCYMIERMVKELSEEKQC